MKRGIFTIIMMLVWAGQAYAQTPTPEPDYSASASASSVCFYNYADVQSWVSSMEVTESSIDSLIQGIAGEDSVSVTIDSNPFSLARGFILLMSDVTWLQTIFTFFMVAFSVIVILTIVKTIRALWGPIKDFIMPLIKMLPFIG